MTPDDTLFVAGHRGMVGTAILRRLQAPGDESYRRRTPWARLSNQGECK